MAEAVTLGTETRKGKGGRDAARQRKAGRVPAVVYGHKEEPLSITVPRDELLSALRLHARTLQLTLGGKSETVLIKDIQHNHLGSDVLHVDFLRVSADERIKTTVEIELRGIAPGVLSGGVLDQPLHAIHVECLAIKVPESIRVKIEALTMGQAIHVRELELPEGVKALDDGDLVVVQVKQAAAMPEPTAGEPGEAEPEIITKKKEKPTDEE